MPKDEQRGHVYMTALWELDRVRKGVGEANASVGRAVTDAEACAEIISSINSRISFLQQTERVHGISAELAGREISATVGDWSAFVDEHLGGLPTNTEIKRRARVMVRESLRATNPSPWRTGLVVAGFGTDQLFPALSHYIVDGTVAGRVRAWQHDNVCIGQDLSASVRPFAQEDMVVTFMDGLHPAYPPAFRNLVDETIGMLIDHFSEQVEDALSADKHSQLLDEMVDAKAKITAHFQDRPERRSQESTRRPDHVHRRTAAKRGTGGNGRSSRQSDLFQAESHS